MAEAPTRAIAARENYAAVADKNAKALSSADRNNLAIAQRLHKNWLAASFFQSVAELAVFSLAPSIYVSICSQIGHSVIN